MLPAPKKPRTVEVSKGPCVWWARNDLRMQDNPVIRLVCGAALVDGRPFCGVFCFDPRFLDSSPYGRVTDPEFQRSISTRAPVTFSSRKTGALRARFWIDCVLALRREMEARGSKLFICYGKPEEVLGGLPKGTEVKCQSEPVSIEQTDVEEFVAKALINGGSKLRKDPGAMSLYHPDDLPFDPKARPESYSELCFKLGWKDAWTSVEREENAAPIRPCVPSPTVMPSPPENLDIPGLIPEDVLQDETRFLEHLGYSAEEIKEAQSQSLPKGGEEAARLHLEQWAGEQREEDTWSDENPSKKNTALFDLPCAGLSQLAQGHDPFQWANLAGPHGGLRISHYMAVGCISAREIFHRARDTPNFAMAAHRLLWRDFHRLYAMKYHRKIAWLSGPARVERTWKQDPEIAEAWKQGKTGVPYIDACQRELRQTGWLAYKGRKTSAHFLIFDLWMDWRIGAFFDEETLLDYDFAMNYGNWGVCAKIGNGGASAWWGSVEFDPQHTDLRWKLFAEQKNDPEGAYIRRWVPELQGVKGDKIHEPWSMAPEEMASSGCVIGRDYPSSLVGPLDLASCKSVEYA